MVMHDHLDDRRSKKRAHTFGEVRPARLGLGAAQGEYLGHEKHLDSLVQRSSVMLLRTPSDLQDSETGAYEKTPDKWRLVSGAAYEEGEDEHDQRRESPNECSF